MSNIQKQGEPLVFRMNFLTCNICVPKDWTEEQILKVAEEQNPAGTSNGWFVYTQEMLDENEYSKGTQAIVPCDELEGHVHYILGV
jgi:hypothetical protein